MQHTERAAVKGVTATAAGCALAVNVVLGLAVALTAHARGAEVESNFITGLPTGSALAVLCNCCVACITAPALRQGRAGLVCF